MKVLLDANVILDVLLNRQPWVADCIVTRDVSGFVQSPVPTMTPTELLTRLLPATP